MRGYTSRINWPFAVIILMAFLAVLGRIVLVRYFGVPAFVRHHMADFCFTGFFTFFVMLLAAPLRGRAPNARQKARRVYYWMAVPVVGTLLGLWVEFEDYLGVDEEEGWFDPGKVIEWTGAPNTDTFDPRDLVAIFIGGVLVTILQWYSVKLIDRWRRFPLLLETSPRLS